MTNEEKALIIADLNTARAVARSIQVFADTSDLQSRSPQEVALRLQNMQNISAAAVRIEELLAGIVDRIHKEQQ